MLRQRIRVRAGLPALVARLAAALAAVVLVYAGAILLLLALKVAPADVEAWTGYRSVVDALTGLTPADADDGRLVAGLAGLAAFLVCAPLALRSLPRPHLARSARLLDEGERGRDTVRPRAVERIAEIAAVAVTGVRGATARADDDAVVVAITARHARELPTTLRRVHDDVSAALVRHGVPAGVEVVLAGFERERRDLA